MYYEETAINIVKLVKEIEPDEIYNLACPASPPKYLKDPIHTLFTSISIYKICKFSFRRD